MRNVAPLVAALLACSSVPRLCASDLPEGVARPAPEFIANAGQWDARARFAVATGPLAAWIGSDHFAVRVAQDGTAAAVFFRFDSALPDSAAEGLDALTGRWSFFRGADPERWRAGVPAFRRARLLGAAPGVDVQFRAERGAVEYDLIAASAADVAGLAIHVEGALGLALDASGALRVATSAGELRQSPPRAFALEVEGGRRPIDCRFLLLDDDTFGFAVAGAAGAERLVIDPSIQFATFLGGSAYDTANDVAVSAQGDVYVAGTTWSLDYPVTAGAVGGGGGLGDAFVTRLSATGTSALYSAVFGGTSFETGDAIGLAEGPAGVQAIVAGTTYSTDFPTTGGAFDGTANGDADLFVARLDATGSALVYSTYLGGSAADADPSVSLRLVSLAVEPGGSAVLAGATLSADFPITPNAFDSTLGSALSDGFVTRLDAGGLPAFSSYVGGSAQDTVQDVELGAVGEVVLIGSTYSADFPITPGAALPQLKGIADAFAMRLQGTAVLYATYVGASSNSWDQGYGGAVASDGTVLIVGMTATPNGGFEGNNVPYFARLFPSGALSPLAPTGQRFATDVAVLGDGTFAVAGGRKFPNNSPLYADVSRFDAAGKLVTTTTSFQSVGLQPSGPALGLAVAGAAEVVFVNGTNLGLAPTPGAFDPTAAQQDGFAIRADLGCDGIATRYGAGCAGPSGIVPDLAASGCASSGQYFELSLTAAPPGSVAFLMAGLGQGALQLPPGCALQIAPLVPAWIAGFSTDGDPSPGSGGFTLGMYLGNIPAAADVYLQCFVPEFGGGFTLSNPLHLHLSPQ